MDQNRQKSLTKAFITFQFSCFPLLWILHRRHIKIRINKINFHFLATEIFKVKKGVCTDSRTVVSLLINFNLRNSSILLRDRNINTFYETEDFCKNLGISKHGLLANVRVGCVKSIGLF